MARKTYTIYDLATNQPLTIKTCREDAIAGKVEQGQGYVEGGIDLDTQRIEQGKIVEMTAGEAADRLAAKVAEKEARKAAGRQAVMNEITNKVAQVKAKYPEVLELLIKLGLVPEETV